MVPQHEEEEGEERERGRGRGMDAFNPQQNAHVMKVQFSSAHKSLCILACVMKMLNSYLKANRVGVGRGRGVGNTADVADVAPQCACK